MQDRDQTRQTDVFKVIRDAKYPQENIDSNTSRRQHDNINNIESATKVQNDNFEDCQRSGHHPLKKPECINLINMKSFEKANNI